MKKLFAAAGAAAVLLSLASPASAGTGGHDSVTYKINAAYTEWSTIPDARADLVPGDSYEDSYMSAYHVVRTYRNKTSDHVFFSYFDVQLRATQRHRLRFVSYTSGRARDANVSFAADHLQSLTASAQLRTRTCYRKPRECVRSGHMDVSAAWTGEGRHYVAGAHFVAHFPGYPTELDNELYDTRDATVDATPAGTGTVVDSEIFQGSVRFSG